MNAIPENSTSPLVTVVIPCYNEEDCIPLLAEEIHNTFEKLADVSYECIFVDDGSTDATKACLAQLKAADGRIQPLSLHRNMGQSAALVAGMHRARGQYIITLDADLQNDPCDIPMILELLAEYDCVCGYREIRNDSWVRVFSSRLANWVRNAILHDGIRDSGCGTKGFRSICVDHIVSFNGVHRFLAVFIRKAGFSIVECPVTHHPRRHGVSKYGIGNRLWRGLFDLIGVAWLTKRYVHPVLVDIEYRVITAPRLSENNSSCTDGP